MNGDSSAIVRLVPDPTAGGPVSVPWEVLEGDCREVLRSLPAGSVQTCVTSPPYFGLRDYGTGEWEGGDPECDHAGTPQQSARSTLAGNGHGPDRLSPSLQAQTTPVRACKCGAVRVDRQIGLEPTPDEFVAAMVAVFREVRRVLRDDGTVWLNLGDSYAGSSQSGGDGATSTLTKGGKAQAQYGQTHTARRGLGGCKPKDLIGIPWMVAFALRADGWYLRSDIIWSKPNPMPESVTDRPTKAHEYVFLLSKGPRYFYDADAVREDAVQPDRVRADRIGGASHVERGQHSEGGLFNGATGRNKRSVWEVATQPFPGAHFATFPPKLIEPCVLAGSSPKACGVCGAPWERVVPRSVPTYAATVDPTRTLGGAGIKRERPGVARQVVFVESKRKLAQRILDVAGDDLPAWRTEFDAMCGGRGNFNHWIRLNGESGHYPPLQAVERLRELGVAIELREVADGELRPGCEHDDDTGRSVVLDPFNGAGTTGLVAVRNRRGYVGVELNPEYAAMARDRIATDVRLGHRPPVREVLPNDHLSLFDV